MYKTPNHSLFSVNRYLRCYTSTFANQITFYSVNVHIKHNQIRTYSSRFLYTTQGFPYDTCKGKICCSAISVGVRITHIFSPLRSFSTLFYFINQQRNVFHISSREFRSRASYFVSVSIRIDTNTIPEIKSGIHGRKLNEYKQKKVLKSDGKQRHRLQMDKIFYDYGYISYRELFISCESGGFATICVCYFALM